MVRTRLARVGGDFNKIGNLGNQKIFKKFF